jgi:hypothetical protein
MPECPFGTYNYAAPTFRALPQWMDPMVRRIGPTMCIFNKSLELTEQLSRLHPIYLMLRIKIHVLT